MTSCLTQLTWYLLVVSALSTTGCFTIAKQAFHEARGAQADVLCVTERAEAALAKYGSLEFKPATTTVGQRICPPELLRAYDRSANQAWAKLKASYPGGGPTLTVDSDILYFQGKGLLGGAFMLTRVTLREADQLVVDALIRAESEAFRAGGEADLAQASVEALRRFLENPRPRPGRRQPETSPAS